MDLETTLQSRLNEEIGTSFLLRPILNKPASLSEKKGEEGPGGKAPLAFFHGRMDHLKQLKITHPIKGLT